MALILSRIVVFLLFIHAINTVRHRHHKLHNHARPAEIPQHTSNENLGFSDETDGGMDKNGKQLTTLVEGIVTCYGRPAKYLRPYLTTNEFPRSIIAIAMTNEKGRYRLSTGELATSDYKLPLRLEIRHMCPTKEVPFLEKCAIPYITISLVVDHQNKTYYDLDIELDKHPAESASFCLY